MDPEWKEKWVAALRSGEYEQATRTLCRYEDGDVVGYCCLGVLTHLVDPNHSELKPNLTKPNRSLGRQIPDDVRSKVGLREAEPIIGGKGLRVLNDDGATFDEIADIIEDRL